MRTRWMLVIGFVAMFVAGGMVGGLVAVNQSPSQSDGDEHPGRQSRLTSQLNLNEEQREQMKQIWTSAMREQMQAIEQRRRELGKQREQAIRDLMTDDQLAQLDAIEAEHQKQSAEIREARHKVFQEAHAKTRALLTPAQQEQFDAELERRREEFGRWGRDRGEHGRSWRRDRGDAGEQDSQQNRQSQDADQPAVAD